jgi:hypothetical protein
MIATSRKNKILCSQLDPPTLKRNSHVGIQALAICSQSTYLTDLKKKTLEPMCTSTHVHVTLTKKCTKSKISHWKKIDHKRAGDNLKTLQNLVLHKNKKIWPWIGKYLNSPKLLISQRGIVFWNFKWMCTMKGKIKQEVCHTMALPFTLKST